MVSLRPVRPYSLFLLPDRALFVLAGGAAHRPLAVRAVADRDPRECPSHARDWRAGCPPPARHLHDLGGAGRHFRGTDRADDAIRQPQLSFSLNLGDPFEPAEHSRGWSCLRWATSPSIPPCPRTYPPPR